MNPILTPLLLMVFAVTAISAKPIKVFVLAGDECVLEEGVVSAADKPGTLEAVMKADPAYGFLKDKDGNWTTRDDVLLYDAHPILNNTEASSRPLQVVTQLKLGGEGGSRMGVDLMLGHVLGNAMEDPVLILRFACRHDIWFFRGSRDLSHDYRPPSSGGDLGGSWDVIHCFAHPGCLLCVRLPHPGCGSEFRCAYGCRRSRVVGKGGAPHHPCVKA